MTRDPVLTFTDGGIYCPAGDFYVDPWRPVDRALITHGHSDHARPGMGSYLATHRALPVMRHRLGDIRAEGTDYGEERRVGDATVSFHPAGHVPGSAQIRVAVAGEVWVVSGDYKIVPDGLSEPWEPVACDAFISECTFGLPVFRWEPQAQVMTGINDWWARNRDAGRVSVIGAYALGKAQRVLANIDTTIGPVLTHGAVEEVNAILRAQGYALPDTIRVTGDMGARTHPGALVIATPGASATPWARRFGDFAEASASGWMALRGIKRRQGAETGFVLSDHADWPGLNAAIRATGAERVFVTHGYTASFRRWLEHEGYEAGIVETAWEGDDAEPAAEVIE
jgi:putative mRNA 3-end processing factor